MTQKLENTKVLRTLYDGLKDSRHFLWYSAERGVDLENVVCWTVTELLECNVKYVCAVS